MRKQGGEPADSFITDLYCLAEHCGNGTLHDELIRDRLVVELLNSPFSEKLQMDAELTLEKAITAVRQSEAVRKQQTVLRGQDSPEGTVHEIKRKFRPKINPPVGSLKPQGPPKPDQRFNSCSRCGKLPPHSRIHCPAKEATCHRCKQKGHYQKMCRTKKLVETVCVNEDSELFLGTIHSEKGKPYLVNLALNERCVEFKIDTGADVTVIPISYFDQIRDGALQPPYKSLSGPNSQPLDVRGKFIATLGKDGKEIQEEIYVIRGLKQPLLGCPAIEALDLIAVVEPVYTF